MLRYVLRLFRRRLATGELEDWVDYMKRSAQVADAERESHKIAEWSALSRQRKWRFAGKTARQTDNRWSRLLLDWQPNFGHGRSRGRPNKRWSDDLASYAGGNWSEVATDVELWGALEHGFVNRIA